MTIKEKLLVYRKEITFAIIIFLVASTSFALGYLVNREFTHAPIIIEKSANFVGEQGEPSQN